MPNLLKTKYLKNVATLFTGSVLSQVLILGLSVFLTRIFTPTEFGIYGIFSAFIAIGGEVVNGRYDQGIIIPKQLKEAVTLYRLCVFLAVVISAFTFLPIIILTPIAADLFSVEIIENWPLWIPIALLFTGINLPSQFLLNRLKKYKALSVVRIVTSATSASSAMALGYYLDIRTGLVVGLVLGQIVAGIIHLIILIPTLRSNPSTHPLKAELKQVAITYSDYPKFAIAGSWLNTLSRQLPFFILPIFFGEQVLGFFALVNRALAGPMGMVGSAFSQVFYERAARADKLGAEKLKEVTLSTLKLLSGISIAPFLLILFYSTPLFAFVFGEEWTISGDYAKGLIPWMCAVLIVSPLTFMMNVKNRLKLEMNVNIGLIIGRIILLGIGGYLGSALTTMYIFGFGNLAFYGIYLLIILGLTEIGPLKTKLNSLK
ncbi:MAG: O-antigen/teichoic acid export membrane protein [Sphingobacteriales bacterium]|jgi:O-antigen/teichoic acid export membrane protein